MKIIKNISEMQKVKKQGKTIAFVPTMGYLHNGHSSLLKIGRKLADILVLSIFVNPKQFAPNEDLDKYPQDLEKDCKIAERESVDIVFLPNKNELYPKDFQTILKLENLPNHLCGISRPSHFAGVSLVVAKLFNIVQPNFAIFGQKDFQQLAIIRQMVEDLNYDIEIIGGEIIREEDGLAMSSRNVYLNKEERKSATCLYKSILKAKEMIKEGINQSQIIIQECEKLINSNPYTKIDYLKIVDLKTLENIEKVQKNALFALAVKLGNTRLIDNVELKIDN